MTFGFKAPLQAPADEGKGGADVSTNQNTGGGTSTPSNSKGGATNADTKDTEKSSGSILGGAGKPADGGKREGNSEGSKDSGKEGSKEGEPSKDAKGEDDKSAKKEGADEDLVLKLPEGMKLDEKAWGEFKPVAKEVGLNSEQASKLAVFYAERRAADQKESLDTWTQLRTGWYDELKNDKEFGGKNFDANVAMAQKALIRFGGPELANELARYGLDNLPGLAKAFAKAGREISEDSSAVDTTEKSKRPLTPEERNRRFYDDMDPPARQRQQR